jgi:hypothetical protein
MHIAAAAPSSLLMHAGGAKITEPLILAALKNDLDGIISREEALFRADDKNQMKAFFES